MSPDSGPAPDRRAGAPETAAPPGPAAAGMSRRSLLLAGGGLGAGAAAGLGAVGIGLSQAAAQAPSTRPASSPSEVGTDDPADPSTAARVWGDDQEPFYGPRQAGVDTPAQSVTAYVAIDLKPGTQRADVRRLLTVLTQDAADLTHGEAPLGDQEPELAARPSRLTVTLGFGPGLMRLVGPTSAPSWLRPLPRFSVDRLQPRWSGGDLLLQIGCDDPLSLAHARRVLLKATRTFGTVRWTQDGFRSSRGAQPAGTTMRNLFGQVDGTVDTAPGSDDHERIVWGQGPDAFEPWIQGGTSLVLRRIRMDLDTWDEVDRVGREDAVGRRLADGAPLTGSHEHDEPDFAARGPRGFPVISDYAHIRRARHPDPRVRIHRRVYSYETPLATGEGGAISDTGMLFASYQADVDEQFVPIQRRLDESDMLNTWTTPVGSAVFAIPPGCDEGGFIGEQLW